MPVIKWLSEGFHYFSLLTSVSVSAHSILSHLMRVKAMTCNCLILDFKNINAQIFFSFLLTVSFLSVNFKSFDHFLHC